MITVTGKGRLIVNGKNIEIICHLCGDKSPSTLIGSLMICDKCDEKDMSSANIIDSGVKICSSKK